MEKDLIFKTDINTPFPLAFIDWCKIEKNIHSLSETENHKLVMEFWKIYSEAGGNVEPWEIAIAKGDKVH